MIEIRKGINSLGWSRKASWRSWLITELILMDEAKEEQLSTKEQGPSLSDFKHASAVSVPDLIDRN